MRSTSVPRHPGSLATLLLVAVVAIAHAPFYVPALYFDDWELVVERMVFHSATWFDAGNRRPLLFTPFLLAHRLFGLNVDAHYALRLVLITTSALLLYGIVRRLKFGFVYAVVCALLFLVFPTDYSRLWLSTAHARWAMLLTLSFGLLLFEYGCEPRWWRWLLAVVCLIVSLGLYEAQLGVVCAWSLFVAWRASGKRVGVRLMSLLPIAVVFSFAVWRSVGYQAVGIEDSYLSLVSFDLHTWIDRLILGYKVSLLWGWTTTIRFLLPFSAGNKTAALLLALVILLLLVLVRMALHRRKSDGGEAAPWRVQTGTEDGRRIAMSGLFGLAMIGAGYLPVIAAFQPTLAGVSSRFNLFATIGSAVFLASSLMGLARIVGRNRSEVETLFVAAALPLLFLGIVTQSAVQYHGRQAWWEQKSIWQQLFAVAPNFDDDTTVLLVLPGFADRYGYQNWQRPPLEAAWEMQSALRLLYDNPTLTGNVIFPDIEIGAEPRLSPQGVTNLESGRTVPFADTVAFLREAGSGKLRPLTSLPGEWVEGGEGPFVLGPQPGASVEPPLVPLRRLVQ